MAPDSSETPNNTEPVITWPASPVACQIVGQLIDGGELLRAGRRRKSPLAKVGNPSLGNAGCVVAQKVRLNGAPMLFVLSIGKGL